MTDARREFSKPNQSFILWVARAALFSFVFQISAVGHWHPDATEIRGLIGSSSHAAHCHGDVSSCEGQTSIPQIDLSSQLKALPSMPRIGIEQAVSVVISDAFVPSPDKPPRAA